MIDKMNSEEIEIIERVLVSLRQNAFGDIVKAFAGGSKMGAFILCSCLIDALVGFSIGKDTTGPDYISFVNDHLNCTTSPSGAFFDLTKDPIIGILMEEFIADMVGGNGKMAHIYIGCKEKYPLTKPTPGKSNFLSTNCHL